MNTKLKLSMIALVGAIALSACNQKPAAEEVAAQVKMALAAEKAKNEEIAAQVKVAVDAEKAKEAQTAASEKAAAVKHAQAKPATQPATQPAAQPAEKPAAPPAIPAVAAKPVCGVCGTVIAVNRVEEAGKGSGLGVVAGGVVGGLLGNQVGKGTGKDVATIAGAIGGAFAGDAIEKNVKKIKRYDLVVRMDDGSEATYHQTTEPTVGNGDKVKIVNGGVVAN